jgi:hypothetical protein
MKTNSDTPAIFKGWGKSPASNQIIIPVATPIMHTSNTNNEKAIRLVSLASASFCENVCGRAALFNFITTTLSRLSYYALNQFTKCRVKSLLTEALIGLTSGGYSCITF